MIRLHRKGGDINILPLADSARIELKTYLKQRRKRSRARALFIILPESKNFARDGLVFGEEIFQEIPDKNERNGTTRFTASFATLLLSQGENLRVIQSLMKTV
jgi:site-specific recombinase XerD